MGEGSTDIEISFRPLEWAWVAPILKFHLGLWSGRG